MCNIAGYIGKRDAAPILAKMLRKQEGFAAGYYTGIAIHDGKKIHTAKVVGDMDNFEKETDALSFKGTMGFIHGRSKSGGDREWGHPFVTEKGDLAYVANGTQGYFATDVLRKKQSDLAAELEAKGYKFFSKVPGKIEGYPTLADGTAIHISELMCEYIAFLVDSGMKVDEAMSHANSELPSEVVSLVIREQNPGSIFVSRVNFSMMIGITDDGDTYLSTTALAFPDDVNFRTIELLPPTTSFEVFAGGYKVSPYPVKIDNIAPITPDIWHRCYERIEKLLEGKKSEPMIMQDVIDSCEDIWPQGKVSQGPPVVYEIMRALNKDGRLGVALVPDAGAFEGYTTNNFKIYIK